MLTKEQRKAMKDFHRSSKRLARHHNKSVRLRLKILKFCLMEMSKRSVIPVTDNEKRALRQIMDFYDDTIKELYKDTEPYRRFIYGNTKEENKDV